MVDNFGIDNCYMFFEAFAHSSWKNQDDILNRLNQIKMDTQIDIQVQDEYDVDFVDLYQDYNGEEYAIEEIKFLTGRTDLGSMEKLKYLTIWFDRQVEKGLFEKRDKH